MPKRPRYSRWRRLPQVFRSGEFKIPDRNPEPQRLTVYLKPEILDAAESQAARAGVATVQEYCADLLRQLIETEQIRGQVAEVEARQGALEGLYEIANDPEYLAEWSAQVHSRDVRRPPAFRTELGPPLAPPPAVLQDPGHPASGDSGDQPAISPAAQVILHHAGQGRDDPLAFLPCLRRGESVSVGEIAELARALQTLEWETREARVLDRRVAFALHRLAYEGQVLHTDAWPGAFDEWTVDTLRAVQEAVERILSGQDIRYIPTDPRPERPS